MVKFRVSLRSKPGMYEQYEGHVDVNAPDVETARLLAIAKLRRGAFPDRSADMWVVTKIETWMN